MKGPYMSITALPALFSLEHTSRFDEKKGEIPRIKLIYKNECLAIFEGDDMEERIVWYIKHLGYLAEWVYRKYQNGGVYVNWTDDMWVDVTKEEPCP